MAFCSNCGKELKNEAKFCANCGHSVNLESSVKTERERVYEGNIHKCPNCGEALKAFEIVCPTCKFELRGVKSSSAVKDLAEKLEQATSEKQRIIIIKNFPIPNTKEDIFEFMLLAFSNFDASYYVTHLHEEDISDAWLVKIEQCYQKAKLVFGGHSDFERIESLYLDVKKACGKEKEKTFKDSVASTLGLCKNKQTNIEEGTKSKNNINKSKGFSSWNIVTKFFWLILNIYTFGIPALLIYIYKKR